MADVHVVTQVINSLLSILVFPIEKGRDPSSNDDIYFDLKQIRACSHYAQGLDDEREGEKGQEQGIEFLKARKDAAKTF